MLLSESLLSDVNEQEKLLEKFDETLKSLRRQFRKLLKERKAHKNCKLSNQSEDDTSVTSTKTNDSIKEVHDTTEIIAEDKNDISMIECNNVIEKSTPDNLDVQEIVENNLLLDEIPEILSVQFDTESEHSLMKQFEESKLNSNNNESQIQKSPVFSRNKIRGKKNFSCKIYPNIEKEKITEIPKSANDNNLSNMNISLFSSVKENDIFTSPKLKPSQKLGVSNLYNVNSKMSCKGNKLKQTKLIFITDEEKTDISKETNITSKAENRTIDSLFDTSLFNSNINVENMDIDMDETFASSKSTIDTTLGSSTPKRITKSIECVFEKISPAKENKIKIKDNISQINSSYEPEASLTQFLSPKKHHSDSDTDFSFQEDHHLMKKKTTHRVARKNLVGFIKKASVLKENSHKDYNQINKTHVNETMMDDETFFSPGEYENDIKIEKTSPKPGSSREITSPKIKRPPMRNFDKISEKKKCIPEYAYDDQVIRRKNERARLNGWSCWDCKKYYEELNLPENELKEYMKKCSRHKAKFDPYYYTPPGFWDPAFPDTLCPSLPEREKK